MTKFLHMKKLKGLYLGLAMLLSGLMANAQTEPEKLNLPGDNLNLYAVLKLFQESPTLEIFEKKLNEEDSKINNLDLDGDNNIDYIKVSDRIDGKVHNIVLQDVVSKTETQDVAVIIVQKLKDNQVQVQVIGDEDLYGKNYIIEPNFETGDNQQASSTPNPGYTGGTNHPIVVENTTTYVISSWPIVSYMYMPDYYGWESPWYWGYYPVYWRPWHPYFWHYYYGWHYHWFDFYYGHYRRWGYCRYDRWNDFYYRGFRARSNYYYGRRERGEFERNYSRPEMVNRGSNDFIRNHPNAPAAQHNPPVYDHTGIREPIRGQGNIENPVRNQQHDGVRNPVIHNNQNENPVRPPVRNPVIKNDQNGNPVRHPVRNPENPGRPNTVNPPRTITPAGNPGHTNPGRTEGVRPTRESVPPREPHAGGNKSTSERHR